MLTNYRRIEYRIDMETESKSYTAGGFGFLRPLFEEKKVAHKF